jgi:uncharacterized protein
VILSTFGWSFLFTAAGLVAGLIYGGASGLVLVAILIVLEVSLSFDNAVVNAKVLERMSPLWQRLFLTVGVLIAVFGMRLAFPLLLVGLTAHIGPIHAVQLAMAQGDVHEVGSYAYLVHDAHPLVAAFGGMFLLLLFLNFLFDPRRELHWLRWLERPLGRVGAVETAPVAVALAALAAAAHFLAEEEHGVLLAGVLGVLTYLSVDGLGRLFAGPSTGPSALVKASGRAGFFLFVYVNLLDASFSFDGVLGAFAITRDPVVILLGLGVGALYIRALTVFLVRRGTLGRYVYLEHGAMWAVGALGVVLLISIKHATPEVITGLIGVGFIGVAYASSLAHNRRRSVPAV